MPVKPARLLLCSWIILVALFLDFGRVSAANVSLSWMPSSSTNVTGYNIYYGTISRNYTGKIQVGKVTTITISNLTCGITYFFSATALDSSGGESGFSNETQFLVPGVLLLGTSATNRAPLARAATPANGSPLNAALKPANPMVMVFPAAPSHWYEVQATVDFLSWTTVWTTGVATSNAWVQFSDTNACAYASRYYRLVLH
jgi:hypothetical protein